MVLKWNGFRKRTGNTVYPVNKIYNDKKLKNSILRLSSLSIYFIIRLQKAANDF
jgi:hypothetical protein